MTNAGVIALVGGVVGGLLSLLASFLVARTNAKATRQTAMTAPYEHLADRVVKLEVGREEDGRTIAMMKDRMTVMMADRDALVAYLRAFREWAISGAKPPPPPVPTHLHAILDPEEWEVSKITERITRYATPPREPEEPST